MTLSIRTDAFADNALIPQKFTGEGDDVSPALQWSGAPPETQSFVLIMDDPDAPRGTWTHWTLFDLPPSTANLAEGWQPGQIGVSGLNDSGNVGYNGPFPPRGHGPHRYFFRLYALDVPKLALPEGVARNELERAMTGHVLAQAQTMGRYERR